MCELRERGAERSGGESTWADWGEGTARSWAIWGANSLSRSHGLAPLPLPLRAMPPASGWWFLRLRPVLPPLLAALAVGSWGFVGFVLLVGFVGAKIGVWGSEGVK